MDAEKAETVTERFTLAEHAAAAIPFLSKAENEPHLVKLLDELAAIERDARREGRW